MRALVVDDGRSGHELLRLLDCERQCLLVDGVALRDRDDAVLDPEQPQDGEVLVRLRPRALGRVDDEQEEVDPGRAGDHVADEALVPGHVDDGEPPPVRQLERRVAEVDRDAALLLLGQPVGVLARQRPDEPGLAVVDVARGAEDQRHATLIPGPLRRRPRPPRTSASVSVRQSSSSFPSRTMPTTGGVAGAQRRGQLLLERAGEARRARRAAARRRRPAPTVCSTVAAGQAGEPLGACAAPPSAGSASIRRTGISARARSGSR